MASAQVLPNTATSSRKQEHLEAGKRRLEEFRRKKAAERAKKTASTGQSHMADNSIDGNQHLQAEVRDTDSGGVDTSDVGGGAVIEPSGLHNHSADNRAVESFQNSEQSSSNGTHSGALSTTNKSSEIFADRAQSWENDQERTNKDPSWISSPTNLNLNFNEHIGINTGTQGGLKNDRVTLNQSNEVRLPAVQDIDNRSSQVGYSQFKEAQPVQFSFSLDDSGTNSSSISYGLFGNASPERFDSSQLNKSGYAGVLSTSHESSYEARNNMHFKEDTSNLSSSGVQYPTTQSAPPPVSESLPSSFKFDSGSYSAKSGSITRSRPSFLDSINVSRVSSSHSPLSEPQKIPSFVSNSTDVQSADVLGSSSYWKSFAETKTMEPVKSLGAPHVHGPFEYSMKAPISASNGSDRLGESLNGNLMEREHEYQLPKQDENFASLEQHIEDLTQEKFSLQRALEASRALAESLAAENSSLTDSYNQQGSVVNQLKFEMEKLQEEIKAQLVELEAIKIEYANVLLECNAADERAKLLASEVIGLEDKALRLRSSELKLERQLENSVAEISSCKKKISSLEKERRDLQSTIDALQEEKKLLQSKLRKASSSGKSIDVLNSISKKDASISTEDLVDEYNADIMQVTPNVDMEVSASLLGSDAASFASVPTSREFSIEVSSVNIPAEQIRMIQNINEVISELALEKEQLMLALEAESTQNLKLKEFNKELSRKLEGQTQRLELLTAQRMANGNVSGRQLNPLPVQDSTLYADEGDEVVDRVLGWIMKLFPGGPSRRRTSKLN